MHLNDIKVKAQVTWGAGIIRAEVEAVRSTEGAAVVRLLEPYTVPPGPAFPEGVTYEAGFKTVVEAVALRSIC